MLRTLVAIVILVMFWIALDYALVHGAEIELQTAGSTYADPSPYYKGEN